MQTTNDTILENLRAIQAKLAEAHCLLIDEVKRLASPEDHTQEIEEAQSRWRAPGTKDIGKAVRVSIWIGVHPQDMRPGLLVDIRKDQQLNRNEYLVADTSGAQQWWPVAWIESEAEQLTTADVLTIERFPVVRTSQAAEIEERPDHPRGLGPAWRFLEAEEYFRPGDMVNANGFRATGGWIDAKNLVGRKVSEWASSKHIAARRIEEDDRVPGYEHQGQVVEVRDSEEDPWEERTLLAVLPEPISFRFICTSNAYIDRYTPWRFSRVRKGS